MAAAADGPVLMRSMRVLAILAIGGLLLAGVLVDIGDRAVSSRADQYESALVAPTGVVNTWFCPGGSRLEGIAELTVQMVNRSDEPRTVTVSVLPGGSAPQDLSTLEMNIEARGRVLLQPSEAVPDAEWVGVMVETTGADVVVEQLLTAAQGVGRSLCLTRTAESWIVSNGATRSAVEKERFVVMLLNPFPDVAVVDIELVADVGRDSIDGLVVPAQRVAAVDITSEVTVASTVAAFIDVVSGRVAASWIQIADGLIAGRGIRTAPAVPGAADLWHLPVAAVGPDRRDVVAVSNPSSTDTAEVDVEILPEDPQLDVGPIEITVRPGRTALIDLSRQGRLEGIGHFSLAVRSLTPVPVAASITSVTSAFADSDSPADTDGAGAAVAVSTATIGADGVARRWLVPAEGRDADGAAGLGTDTGSLVIVNPSAAGIAQADVSVDGSLVRSIEIGPLRSLRLPLAGLGSGNFVVEVDSSAPVVVGREVVGLTSRSASLGVVVDQPVPIAGIR
ncbi:MAG: hypothetical protein F4Y05_05525 [Acidimicrobiaceae bacterium]|nr:hypothetical protein [Acidimicrobiaceae bacterium]